MSLCRPISKLGPSLPLNAHLQRLCLVLKQAPLQKECATTVAINRVLRGPKQHHAACLTSAEQPPFVVTAPAASSSSLLEELSDKGWLNLAL